MATSVPENEKCPWLCLGTNQRATARICTIKFGALPRVCGYVQDIYQAWSLAMLPSELCLGKARELNFSSLFLEEIHL